MITQGFLTNNFLYFDSTVEVTNIETSSQDTSLVADNSVSVIVNTVVAELSSTEENNGAKANINNW